LAQTMIIIEKTLLDLLTAWIGSISQLKLQTGF